MKFFNTAGPVVAADHYALAPLSRIDFDELMSLIQQKKYFVLHAPRQTGKTSMLLALMAALNSGETFRCLYINVESGQSARENVGAAMKSILFELANGLQRCFGDDHLVGKAESLLHTAGPHSALRMALSSWATNNDKPLILLIDEIDALVGDTLISVLRQLRTGYPERPKHFPQSIVLCGVRDVRDYRIHASSEKDPITGGSAFNVKAESLRLGNFNQTETFALLKQHTDETGQVFTPEALAAIWWNTQGQPWLVNALAHEVTYKIKANRNRSKAITESMVATARENLIQRQDTHLDQLADKLREPRVHRVIAPLLAGADLAGTIQEDDITYVHDLGLIEKKPQIAIANPIYQEVIPRVLTAPTQATISHQTQWYISPETGLLNMAGLMTAFQQFFRENSGHWSQQFQYKEAGPQLLLQAFLQRVVNGGGRIEREYGLGRGRTDLLVVLPHAKGEQKIVLELKIQREKRETTIRKALPQITGYMDHCGAQEGHLILFDQGDGKWEDKIYHDQVAFEGSIVQIWGM